MTSKVPLRRFSAVAVTAALAATLIPAANAAPTKRHQTAPTATITDGPANGSTSSSPSASFSFKSNLTGSSFKCSIDSSAYSGCTSPAAYSSLSDGSHTFRVAAVKNGMTGTPATDSWTVASSSTSPTPTPTPTPTPSPSAYFSADPNVTGTLAPWQYFDAGGTFSVSNYPNGVTSPGVVGVRNDPLGQEGKVYQQTVTPNSNWFGGASRGDWTYLYNDQSAAYYGHNGQENWVHFKVMFPGNGAYNVTQGEWNTTHEAHMNSDFTRWSNTCEDAEITLDVVQYSGDASPYLGFRVLGGNDTCPMNDGSSVWTYDPQPLKFDHWYDITYHVIWSPDASKGYIQWWRDGQLMLDKHMPTLWQRPDGSTDVAEFELNNYRLHNTSNSTLYYSKTKIGPTQASVGF
jgi:hypothetical protein